MLRTAFQPVVRWSCLPAVGLMLLLTAGVAQSKPNKPGMPRAERHESRQEILQLEQQWKDAVIQHNVSALEGLLSDDYIGITSNGMLESKEQTLVNLKNGVLHLTSIDVSDRKVRFYGKTAVVTSKADVNGNGEDGSISGNYRYTRVYVRDPKGGWKIVSFEASRIKEPTGMK
ncbi:MAG TPA: nuclear transport factor 2 family protein [Terracidiphilus sp.]|jgi:ketosteroid isomerase-like protein|nr:nuclear transport factor 2 family protein [Terracidiphilus sp.]